MKLLNVEPTPNSSQKRLVATFCECKGPTKCLPKDRHKIAFGSKDGFTYADGADEKTKLNYIKRHQVNENWNKINAGSLSRYILWSKKSISQGVAEFRKIFKC
jgi:hypothetical protein